MYFLIHCFTIFITFRNILLYKYRDILLSVSEYTRFHSLSREKHILQYLETIYMKRLLKNLATDLNIFLLDYQNNHVEA